VVVSQTHSLPIMDSREELRALLLKNSVKRGDFTLASGKKSDLYVDCRTTTIHAKGALLIGELCYQLVQETNRQLNVQPDSIGGMTLGADPITLATAMESARQSEENSLRPFVVRKEPKKYGMGSQIEGNFKEGDQVIVIEDTATTGGSALKAIAAIEASGGKVAYVVVLVDREEGGLQNIEAAGYPVRSLYTRTQLFAE